MKKIVDINTGWHEKIVYNQNDTVDFLLVEIQKDRKKIKITDYQAVAYFRLVDGTVVKQKSIIEDNLVRIDLKNILKNKGIVEMEIVFTKEDKKITTFIIEINIK